MLEQKSPYTDVTEFMPYAVATAKRLIADNNMQGLQLLIDDLCQLSTDIDSFVDEIPDAVDKYHKLMAQKAALEEQIRGQKKSLDDLERLRSEEFGVNNAMRRLDSISCDDLDDVVESKDIGEQTSQQIDSFFGGDDGFDFDVHDDDADGTQQPRMGQASAFGATYDDDDVPGDPGSSAENDVEDDGQGYAMEEQTSERVPFDDDDVPVDGQMADGQGDGYGAQHFEQQYEDDADDDVSQSPDGSKWQEQEADGTAVQPDPFSQYGQEQDASDDDDDEDDEPQALSMDAVMRNIEESSEEQNDDGGAADDQEQDDEQPRRRKRKRGKRGSGKGTASDGEQRDDGNEHVNDIEGLSNIDEILGDDDFTM